MQPSRWSLVVVMLSLCALPALAGRTLDEPAEVRAAARMVPKAKQEKALKAAGLSEECQGAVMRSRELAGIACRLAIHGRVDAGPVETEEDVQDRAARAKAALAAARSIASYEPLARKPHFKEHQARAHKQACLTALTTWDALSAASKKPDPVGKKARAAAGSSEGGLFQEACECARATVGLGSSAGASPEEIGRLQTLLTSRQCFLDKTKIAADRGGPASEFSGRAGRVALENTDEARLLEYAKARDIGLDRCRDKGAPRGTVTDKGKLKRCACGEIKRWSFPKKRGRPPVDIVVPLLGQKVGVRVTVNAPGKVTECGPLEGPGL